MLLIGEADFYWPVRPETPGISLRARTGGMRSATSVQQSPRKQGESGEDIYEGKGGM